MTTKQKQQDRETNARTLITTYYKPGKGAKKDIIRVTRGSNRDEIVPNISRAMTTGRYHMDNLYAGLAISEDGETGELLCVATYKPGESFKVKFVGDVTNPICITDIPED